MAGWISSSTSSEETGQRPCRARDGVSLGAQLRPAARNKATEGRPNSVSLAFYQGRIPTRRVLPNLPALAGELVSSANERFPYRSSQWRGGGLEQSRCMHVGSMAFTALPATSPERKNVRACALSVSCGCGCDGCRGAGLFVLGNDKGRPSVVSLFLLCPRRGSELRSERDSVPHPA